MPSQSAARAQAREPGVEEVGSGYTRAGGTTWPRTLDQSKQGPWQERRRRNTDAISGRDPFIMQSDGKGWLLVCLRQN